MRPSVGASSGSASPVCALRQRQPEPSEPLGSGCPAPGAARNRPAAVLRRSEGAGRLGQCDAYLIAVGIGIGVVDSEQPGLKQAVVFATHHTGEYRAVQAAVSGVCCQSMPSSLTRSSWFRILSRPRRRARSPTRSVKNRRVKFSAMFSLVLWSPRRGLATPAGGPLRSKGRASVARRSTRGAVGLTEGQERISAIILPYSKTTSQDHLLHWSLLCLRSSPNRLGGCCAASIAADTGAESVH